MLNQNSEKNLEQSNVSISAVLPTVLCYREDFEKVQSLSELMPNSQKKRLETEKLFENFVNWEHRDVFS